MAHAHYELRGWVIETFDDSRITASSDIDKLEELFLYACGEGIPAEFRWKNGIVLRKGPYVFKVSALDFLFVEPLQFSNDKQPYDPIRPLDSFSKAPLCADLPACKLRGPTRSLIKHIQPTIDWRRIPVVKGTLLGFEPVKYDIQFGKILEKLEQLRLSEQTIYRCFSNHGSQPHIGSISITNAPFELPYELLSDSNETILHWFDTVIGSDDIGDFGDCEWRIKFRLTNSYWYMLISTHSRIDNHKLVEINTRVFHLLESDEIKRVTSVTSKPHRVKDGHECGNTEYERELFETIRMDFRSFDL